MGRADHSPEEQGPLLWTALRGSEDTICPRPWQEAAFPCASHGNEELAKGPCRLLFYSLPPTTPQGHGILASPVQMVPSPLPHPACYGFPPGPPADCTVRVSTQVRGWLGCGCRVGVELDADWLGCPHEVPAGP